MIHGLAMILRALALAYAPCLDDGYSVGTVNGHVACINEHGALRPSGSDAIFDMDARYNHPGTRIRILIRGER